MRVLIALVVSVLVHLLLAAGLGWYLGSARAPVAFARLDLSRVEISLAEEDAETAAPAASPPAGAAAEKKLRPEMPGTPEPPSATQDPALPALPEPERAEPAPCEPDLPEIPAPRQAKIDAPPKPVRAIRPDYPHAARLKGEEGDVVLEIRVSASGDASDVRVVGSSGSPRLDEAAVRAVCAARFAPAKSGSEAVSSTARLTINFKLK